MKRHNEQKKQQQKKLGVLCRIHQALKSSHQFSLQRAEATCEAAAEQLEPRTALPSMGCQRSIIRGPAEASETDAHNVCTRMQWGVDTTGSPRPPQKTDSRRMWHVGWPENILNADSRLLLEPLTRPEAVGPRGRVILIWQHDATHSRALCLFP